MSLQSIDFSISQAWNQMNLAQKIFGISTFNTYLFVGFFLLLTCLIILVQVWLVKKHKKWISYLTFSTIFLALIIVLPFNALVHFIPWGLKDNHSVWYAQILQFAIVIGNVYMIALVIALLIALFFNIIKTIFEVIYYKHYQTFFKSLLWFLLISASMLLLINLYRVFPIYNYDMSNNPNYSFVNYGSPIGLDSFLQQGYWPFFLTNFLIAYFFTGNYKIQNNTNLHYLMHHFALNRALPVQVPIVLALFSLALVIGIIFGVLCQNKSTTYLRHTNKIKNYNNRVLNVVYACLPVASFSFFSESLLQSQIGTWMHLTFVFVFMLIAWSIFYLFSFLTLLIKNKNSFQISWKLQCQYLHHAFLRNNLNDNEFVLMKQNLTKVLNKSNQVVDQTFDQIYQNLCYIAEIVIFALALIGYLSFMPTNGWSCTSNVNCAGYWIGMFVGSFYCYLGSYELSNMATVGQNIQASCAFNVMCGTNTGIFGPFGFLMNKFRVQINLNFIAILMQLALKPRLEEDKKMNRK